MTILPGDQIEVDFPAGGFPRAAHYISMGVAALFLLLCCARVHGFSLPAWHLRIDGSAAPEVLAGEARWVRSDDWATILPSIFAQDAQVPSFPPVSGLVGYGGASTLVGHPVPVRSWVTLFRPQLWGYFAGRDFGMAWHWWLRMLALFEAALLACLLLTRNRVGVSVAAAAALAFSPYFQFWSFISEPLAAMGLLAFVAVAGVASARSLTRIVLWGAALAWFLGCVALGVVYPPFQISLAWLLLFLGGSYFWREREKLRAASLPAARAFALAGAVGSALTAAAVYFVQNREAIRRVQETVYPGHRMSSGGDVSIAALWNGYFTPFMGPSWHAAFGNISDASSFFFFSPLVLGIAAWERRNSRRPDPVVLALGAFVFLAVLYAVLGVPESMARLFFGGRVPGPRFLLALGIADLAIIALHVSSRAARASGAASASEAANAPDRSPGESPFIPLLLAGLWAAVVCGAGLVLASRVEGAPLGGVLLVGVGALAVAVSVALRARGSMAALAVATFASTVWFNPLVRGGSDYLRANPLSKRLLEIDREHGGGTRWVVYEDGLLPDLFRAIGLRAINGVHYYPQRELWSRLGLTGSEHEQIYNRHAHVVFVLPEDQHEPKLDLAADDTVRVALHPDHPLFSRLDLDYLLYVGADPGVLRDAARLTFVASVGDKHIFRVSPRGS